MNRAMKRKMRHDQRHSKIGVAFYRSRREAIRIATGHVVVAQRDFGIGSDEDREAQFTLGKVRAKRG